MQARRLVAAAAAAVLSIAVVGCGTSTKSENKPASSGDKGTVRISGQAFPEAALVAAMYQQLFEKAGYSTDVKLVQDRSIYMGKGEFPGSVDVVPEYLGGIVDYLNTQANGAKAKSATSADLAATLAAGRKLASAAGITLLEPAKATDANAFFVTKKYAEQNDLTNLSSLKGKSVVLASAPDCMGRTDCGGGLEKTYGIKITKDLPLGYASDQTYQSVLKGESQLGETSTTDGTLDAQGLQLLPDDKAIQPVQNLIPAVSSSFLTAHPDVKNVLGPLMSALTTDDLVKLNSEISNDRKKPADVAKEYLTEKGLL